MNDTIRFLLIATCVYSASGHDDLEGFCAAVLPAYENHLNEIEFVDCECEESHSGKEQTRVVCTFIKDIASKSTASCNAKYCLFTQQCKEPYNFNALELGANAFDLSLFDKWCVDENTYQRETYPTRYPSQSPMKEIESDQSILTSPQISKPSISQNNTDTTSHAGRAISSFEIMLATTLILPYAII